MHGYYALRKVILCRITKHVYAIKNEVLFTCFLSVLIWNNR